MATVSEDAPPNTPVAAVLGDSRMQPGAAVCSLTRSSSALFDLRRPDDGDAAYHLVTTSTLDRELQSVHRLSVQCRQSATDSVDIRSVVDVSVLDVNDNRPQVVSDTPVEVHTVHS